MSGVCGGPACARLGAAVLRRVPRPVAGVQGCVTRGVLAEEERPESGTHGRPALRSRGPL